jgi:hypothetical protein
LDTVADTVDMEVVDTAVEALEVDSGENVSAITFKQLIRHGIPI